MGKKVWILNHYASTDYSDRGGRHYCLSKYLKQYGYEPTVFCCNRIHNSKNNCIDNENDYNEEFEEESKVKYVFLKGRAYNGNGIRRIINMLDFYTRLLKICPQYAKKYGGPDVIYASSVHPLTLVAGIKLSRKYGIKCICEVRDLWPESIVEYSSSIKKHKLFIKLLYLGERWIYKNSDLLIFTFEGGYDYIREKGWTCFIPETKVNYINNGVDLDAFNYNKEHYSITDNDLENGSLFKVVYTGSVRRVNNIGRMLDIAKFVKNKAVIFLIWGDGDELESLKERALDEHIENVSFKGRVEKKYIPFITSKADLNIAHNNDSSLFRFGISFNKIFDYMAAEKPILVDFDSKYNPVINIGAGIETKGFSPEEIAQSIDDFVVVNNKEYSKLCRNAAAGAKEYDYKTLAKKLSVLIDRVSPE